jgi:hypothetical protein
MNLAQNLTLSLTSLSEASFLREMEEAERNNSLEQQIMDDQVRAYEDWANSAETSMETETTSDGNVGAVVCPMCQISEVIVTDAGVILCRRHANNPQNSCPLRIDSHTEGMTLSTFQRMLDEVYANHSSIPCAGGLTFEMRQNFGISALHAFCHACGANAVVV